MQLKAENCSLRCYQSDGGKELISKNIVKFLSERGTKLIYSPPYTPELNAVPERNHRTIFESAHAMLLESGLPTMLFTYAVQYAALIFNHFPTQTAQGEMSPIEAKYGIVPNVSKFKKWGCLCYTHIPASTRPKGFIEKSYKAYFIGFDTVTQCYKTWVIDLSEERISNDVIFDEHATIKKISNTSTLEIDNNRRHVNDYLYLIGMVYQDDEDQLLYTTTQVRTSKGFIVADRAPVLKNGVVGKEEARPIHVADVERMLELYLRHPHHAPTVIVDGSRSVTLDKARNGTSSVPSRPASGLLRDTRNIWNNRSRDPLSKQSTTHGVYGNDKSSMDVCVPAQEEQEEETGDSSHIHSSSATRTPDDDLSAQQSSSTRRRKREVINVGKLGDITQTVNLSSESGWNFELNMMNMFEHHSESAFYLADINDENSKISESEESKWMESDVNELRSLILEHNCWCVKTILPGKKPITSKWVRKIKADGRYKSRLCGRGFNMIQGVDYNETFAPVAKMVTFRVFLTIVAVKSLYTGSLDIKTAYLNAPIKEDVWMVPPKNFIKQLKVLLSQTEDEKDGIKLRSHIKGLKEGKLLKLNKAIYGTKQAGREWYLLIDKFLKQIGFKSNRADHCFFTLNEKNEYVLLLLYVDDMIIAASTEDLKMKYVNMIGKRFKTSYSGELKDYLNIAIDHRRRMKRIKLDQIKYIEYITQRFGIEENRSVESPMVENQKLSVDDDMDSLTEKQLKFVEKFPYRQLMGSILYVNVCTMPSISYAASALGKFNCKPTFLACKALTRLAQYVFNERKRGLMLGGEKLSLVGYADSDWGGDIDTRKSRSGSINYLANGPVVWYSKMQTVTAQSTTESEGISCTPCIQNGSHIRNIINYAHIPRVKFKYAWTLYEDNRATIDRSQNPIHHQRSKHIHMKYQYVMDSVRNGNVVMEYVKSEDNCADVFTKPVGRNIFKRHLAKISGRDKIESSQKKVKTSNEDNILECPRCSHGMLYDPK